MSKQAYTEPRTIRLNLCTRAATRYAVQNMEFIAERNSVGHWHTVHRF